ncbi:MAG: hypothetical protein NPIRA02_24400 [Nitrospirales bacterium]|nr:MAG: hypothetical protein NPIRA02_24400 [Nitrospirales bacterium]
MYPEEKMIAVFFMLHFSLYIILLTFLVTAFTIQLFIEMRMTSFFRHNPGADTPWRVVPDMLSVSTGKIGDPIADVILMKANDRLSHIRVPSVISNVS